MIDAVEEPHLCVRGLSASTEACRSTAASAKMQHRTGPPVCTILQQPGLTKVAIALQCQKQKNTLGALIQALNRLQLWRALFFRPFHYINE